MKLPKKTHTHKMKINHDQLSLETGDFVYYISISYFFFQSMKCLFHKSH